MRSNQRSGRLVLARRPLAIFVICALSLLAIRLVEPRVLAQQDHGTASQIADVDADSATATFHSSAGDSLLPPPGITFSFSNTNPINFPVPVELAAPYPSTINVTNVPPQIAKVTVTLHDIEHTFSTDIEVLLVGPQGQTAVILSDTGGSGPVEDITITLDDEGAAPIPFFGPLVSGTFMPTNGTAGGADNFPAPAPTPLSLNSSLSVFNGTNPNGQWKLFVLDDVGFVDGGAITGGWTLNVTSAFSGQNTTAISIPESGVGSPYPSAIDIADHNNPVSKVRVTLTNFTHTSPDDVDILLMSPSGRAVVLMSDAGGGNSMSNVNLSFDDTAAAALPDSGPIAGGEYRPTDFEPGDTFPAPAVAPTGQSLSSLNGTVANGEWKLFVVDDSGGNVGNVSGGWNVLVGTTAGTISLQGNLVATPYPAELTISGMPGNISRATVSIQNFSHTSPDDVDILLVGPDGRNIVLMSDAGGATETGGVNLTFDDNATAAIPDNAQIVSGTFRPADYEPGDLFPAPAPAARTGTTLQAFFGGVPNGTWRLYVVGDGASSFGSIAGTWSVTLQASTSACLFQVSPTVQAFPVGGGSGVVSVTQPTGCGWTASTTDSFISITSGSSGGGNGAIGFSVAANQGPARTGTIDVTNGVLVRSFQVQQPSGCPLALSRSTINFAGAGGTGSVSVSAGGVCSWQGFTLASWIQITSAPQSGDGTLTFSVQPNTTRLARSAVIDVGSMSINVNQAPTRATAFDFDGDARSDVSVYRPSTGTWWIAPSGQPGTATAQQFGIATDRLAASDYDGDMKTDVAVYRDGVWYVLKSSDGTVIVNTWGTASDRPVPADYDSDGRAEFVVYRPSTGTWWVLRSDGSFSSTAFGLPTDIPTPGDYDGDGKTDISVYRPSTASPESGTWWIISSATGIVSSTTFGVQGDVPVPGDYDGDGRDNIAVYRPSNGFWYRSTDPATNYDAVQWGITGDEPVAGDYDGDGRADPAVVRPGANIVWHMLGSTSGARSHQFGAAGDRAVPGRP